MDSSLIWPEAKAITRQLQAGGHAAYLVGGCVRDLLLGLAPKDFDVATAALPAQVLAMFPGSQLVGRKFGVVLVPGRDGARPVEVATFRRDGVYTDGRRPEEVNFVATAEVDARRRDFTINGLYLEPERMEVFDFVGGRQDLAERRLRAIGKAEERFAEDHLRLLRAVRFAARFGLEIEAETARAIRRQAAAIHQISVERIRDELTGIFTQGGAARGLRLLDELGLLDELLPEWRRLQGVAQPPEYHPEGDVWTHVGLMLEAMGPATVTLAWAVLLHDIAKPDTFSNEGRIRFLGHEAKGAAVAREVLRRLRYSDAVVEQVEALVANHMVIRQVEKMKLSTQKRLLRQPWFAELLELHRLDQMGSNRDLRIYEFAKGLAERMPPEELRPRPLLDGRQVMAMGVPAGPGLGQWMQRLEEATLQGEIADEAGAREWLRQQPDFPAVGPG